MDQRMFLAIGLSMVVIVAFYAIFPPPRKTPPVQEPATQEMQPPPATSRSRAEGKDGAGKSGVTSEALPAAAAPSLAERVPGRIVTVDTPHYVALFDTRGGKLVSFQLKEYRLAKDSYDWGELIPPLRAYIHHDRIDPNAPVEMVKRELPGLDTLGLWFVEEAALTREMADMVFSASREKINLAAGAAPETLELRGATADGLTVTKTLTFAPDTYQLDYAVAVINYGAEERALRVRHLFGEGAQRAPVKSGYSTHNGPIYQADGSVETEDAEDLQQLFPVRDPDWVGITDTYFLSAARPESPISYAFYQADPNPVAGAKPEWIAFYGAELPVVTLAPNKQIVSRFKLYLGPKKTAELAKFGHGLEKSLDMRLEILATPLLAMLRWFYGFTGNYGVAIILLTIMVRLALFPLTYKGMVSMKRMQKLQPKMAAIREKHKADKERMNREMMALYKRSKVNPLGGCLPILFQLPIFFALYSALGGAIELRHSPFIFWITDLSAKDGLYITPVLMGASMMIQQRLTPTTPDPMQAKILMWMPAVFTVFMLPFPAGLTVYWFTSNLLSILQQLVINRIKVPEPAEHPA